MHTRTVLISGAGIAGPALAYWLLRRGFVPTLVERAPAPRSGGYMIDVWGIGWQCVERMQLLPRICREGYHMERLSLVDRHGRQVAKLDSSQYGKALQGKFISVLRGDLATTIYAQIDGQVETLFGDSIEAITQDADSVDVQFRHAAPRRFDLVIGADGLHSKVRELVFGAHARFEHHLGYGTASFTCADYPHRDESRYVSYCAPGCQVARYALRDNRSAFFFVFTDPGGRRTAAPNQAKATLDALYARQGWECDEILAAMHASDDLYFDAVSQTRMENWYHGHVALLGDACFCPSLLAGEGSALAMLGAHVLAGELQLADGDPAIAFARYQQRLQGFIGRKQKSAARYGRWFAPATRLGVSMRNLATTVMNTPPFSNWALRGMLGNQFAFPAYPEVMATPPIQASNHVSSQIC